jgi:hypothetical protein
MQTSSGEEEEEVLVGYCCKPPRGEDATCATELITGKGLWFTTTL